MPPQKNVGKSYQYMLNRWRLPPDNFPDDTETYTFQHYRGDTNRLVWYWRVFSKYQRTVIIASVVGLGLLGIIAFVWWPKSDTSFVVVPAGTEPPAVPGDLLQLLGGDFPREITDRRVITIPARIEDILPVGAGRGYVFRTQAGITWRITLESDGSFDPVLALYGPPDGVFIAENDNRGPGDPTSELILPFTGDGLYAIAFKSSDGVSGGAYRLVVLPFP
jgi:hypothetical protein